MIAALLSFLSGRLGRVVAIGGAVVALGGAAWGAVALHDRAVQAELVAEQNAATAAKEAQLHAATVAAFGRLLANQQAAAQHDARTIEEIDHAPATQGCIGSPAVAAALRGLRAGAGGDSGAGGSGSNALVPAGAGAGDHPD